MGMKNVCAMAVIATAILIAVPSRAEIIDFDDLAGDGELVANGYGGLQWENFHSLDPLIDMPMSGYNFAVTSGRNVVYSASDVFATIGGLSNKTLDFGYFTAAYNDGLTISAHGYNGDLLIHQSNFEVTTTDPTRFDFGWNGITRVVFSSSGGTDQMFDMSGTNFAIDDLGVSSGAAGTVPEPATWLTMALGFGLLGGALRGRQKVKVALPI